jgi:regulatory protein
VRITKIEAQVKAKGRYSIFIDDAFAFGLSELGLIDSGLRVGQELTPSQITVLKEDAQTDKLYNMLLSLIARRPRSRWEVEDYLRRKNAELAVIQELVAKLQSKGFIDDHDFARRWIESRRLLKPTSKRKLELELRTKRVADSVIKEVLADDETEEIDVLREEVARKRRQTRYQDDTKLMQYLARQGYKYDDIKRALTGDAG